MCTITFLNFYISSRDQIDENNALIEDLEKRTEAYNAVQRAASEVISKANKSDPAVRDIKNKLDKLNKYVHFNIFLTLVA